MLSGGGRGNFERKKKMEDLEISALIGKTIVKIDKADDMVTFYCNDNSAYRLYHQQDCCENVYIEDVIGDMDDLIGSPVLMAEEATSEENPEGFVIDYQESFTWTFYKMATVKGYVTIRWYGSSNGYYSERVDFCQLPTGAQTTEG